MNILFTLTKIANRLDRLGLYEEANHLDLILKQAVDMSPEEYERYYGKPKYESSTISKELDVKTPEGYKQYFGREMPKIENQKELAQPDPQDLFKKRYPDEETHYTQQGLVELIGFAINIFDIAMKHMGKITKFGFQQHPGNYEGTYHIQFSNPKDFEAFIQEAGDYSEGAFEDDNMEIDFGSNVYLVLEKSEESANVVLVYAGLGNNEPLAREVYYKRI